MAKFDLGVPIETDDNTPFVQVDVDPQVPLAKGIHVFQLVVIDDDGLHSDPASVEVVVMDDRKPTAVLDAPKTVKLGQSFTLVGKSSVDQPPGKIVRFVWTFVR
jgi:hypothetical protein